MTGEHTFPQTNLETNLTSLETGLQDTAELAGRLRLAVTRLARQMRQQTDTGLSPTLLATLASVESAGPLTLGELAALERVAPPTITRAVTGLEAEGLVVRRIDPDDRRVARVEVTPAGRKLLERARTRKNAWLARRLRDLAPEDGQRLAEALAVLEGLAGTPEAPR
ncbi:MAG: MarR family winged helix-turn-helix transcriptional regulator [Acidimicrobiia bacterium]